LIVTATDHGESVPDGQASVIAARDGCESGSSGEAVSFFLTVTDFGEVLDSRRRTLKSADSAAIGRDSDVG
jgi:hypothetical protein